MWTENLDNYVNMEPTNSCYLDGRYFNKVLLRYPGLLSNPLYIRITDQKQSGISKGKGKKVSFAEDKRMYIHMVQQHLNEDYPGLLRVVIEINADGKRSRHCNLLILDYKNGVVSRFEPLGQKSRYFNEINALIKNYLSAFFDFDFEVIDIELDKILDEKNPECLARGERTGFCLAYCLLYAYVFVNDKEYFDPSHIRRFAKMVEKTYGSLPIEGADVEYGDDRVGKTLIGGGAGALIGGSLFGPIGLVSGGLLGAGIGASL